MRISLTLIALCLLSLISTGCASRRGGEISLETPDKGQFTETFSNAFFANNKGEYDILLVDNDSAWRFKKTPAKKALQPMEITPVRQALLIHTNWSHRTGAKASPASINAFITWYVLGESSETDMMVYQGVAHVVVHGDLDDPKVTVRIKEGNLAPVFVGGQMADPIGPATITGDCKAVKNDSQLKDILSDMRSRREIAEKSATLPNP